MSTISSKTFSGSFSRYWNENLNFFKKMHFFHFLKLRYVPQCVTHYNFEMEKYFKLAGGKGYIEKKFIPVSSKTFSGSFQRYWNENLRVFFQKKIEKMKFSFYKFDLCMYIVLKLLNTFKIYRCDFSIFFVFGFSVLFPFVSPPLCLPRCRLARGLRPHFDLTFAFALLC